MTLHIGTWVWGTKYGPQYIDRLRNSVARNMSEPYQFHIWEADKRDNELTMVPGCFARLRAFDPEWQTSKGILPNDTLVVLDLDLIVTGSLRGIFDSGYGFRILQGVNSVNPCPFNGSVWALKAGYRPDVFSEFTLEKAKGIPWYAFPDDQAWFHYMMPNAASFGTKDGIYAFKKVGWPAGDNLPRDAKIVCFPGFRDPSQFKHLKWVQDNWR
jgi:hypothetical protein